MRLHYWGTQHDINSLHVILVSGRVRSAVTWNEPTKAQWNTGIRLILTHFKEVKQVTWHAKGDYFCTVVAEGDNRSVIIHQLSLRRSQLPFGRPKGLIQCTLFHPLRPYLFVAVCLILKRVLVETRLKRFIFQCSLSVIFEYTICWSKNWPRSWWQEPNGYRQWQFTRVSYRSIL